MMEKATYPVAGTTGARAEHGVWRRAVVVRRSLSAGEKSIWAETAAAGSAMLVLCSGSVTCLNASAPEAVTDPAFVIRGGGSILLRADSDAIVVSARVPVPALPGETDPVAVVDDHDLSAAAFAFVSALLDSPRPDGDSDAVVERMLSEVAVQLRGVSRSEHLGLTAPAVSY